MDFEELTDEQLAEMLGQEIGLSPDTALRAVSSSDPDLGREYAIRLLSARDQHRSRQEQVTNHRRNLRSSF